MSSGEVIININTKADLTELQKAEAESERVMTKMQKVITFVKTNSQKLLRSMQSIVSLFSGILKTFGVSLGPVGDALLGTISVVIMSVIQMQSILAAGTGGLSLVFGLAMVSAAIAISIMSSMAVARGMNEIQSQLSGAQASTQAALGLFAIWG